LQLACFMLRRFSCCVGSNLIFALRDAKATRDSSTGICGARHTAAVYGRSVGVEINDQSSTGETVATLHEVHVSDQRDQARVEIING